MGLSPEKANHDECFSEIEGYDKSLNEHLIEQFQYRTNSFLKLASI